MAHLRTVELLSYRQELDLRRGMLLRCIRFEDGQGRESTLKERRLVSMGSMHRGALALALTADNWHISNVTTRASDHGHATLSRSRHREGLSARGRPRDAVRVVVRGLAEMKPDRLKWRGMSALEHPERMPTLV